MNTLAPLPIRPAGPLRRAAEVALWLDCRHISRDAADRARAEAAHTVHDMLPPAPGGASPERLSAAGVAVAGPVHGLVGYRRLMRRLRSEAAASRLTRPVAVEYPIHAVDARVNARLDWIGGCEAKAMRFRAGIAGAHLLYDALRRELRSPDWVRATDRGVPAPYLLWSTRPRSGPDRGAEYAGRCLFPGTAVALSPEALRTFALHGVVTGPTAVDLVEARRVVGVLEWFGIHLGALDVTAARGTTSG
ncbi:hypothetical protein ACF061_10360 [Streptomyces sp. NPDC015220]|uniref:hypothetical protein n=1 Tax=Streptomyces sp. NPDC015220 TaxID=3364947 RepID=UPI0036FF173A